LGIGDWGLGPIPNPQTPIPNPPSPIPNPQFFNKMNLNLNSYILTKKYKKIYLI